MNAPTMRWFVACALCWVAASRARANPVDAFGLSSRHAAMANTGTATTEDTSANYYNPAAIVRGRSVLIDIGYRYAQPILRLKGNDVGVDASRGVTAGIIAPASFGSFRFAFGVGVFLPDQRLFRVRSLAFEQPRFVYYDNRVQRMLLSANLAVQIIPGLYIGGGLTFMSQTKGKVGLSGNVAVIDPELSELVSKTEVDLLAIRYPQVGIFWEATRKLTFGLTYRHSFTLELEQTFRIEGNVGNPGMPPVVENGFFETHTIVRDLFQPWQLTFGAAARLTRKVLVTFDLTFARWSEFQQPARNADVTFDIGVFNNGVRTGTPRTFPAAGFHDILIPRLGVEGRVWERGKYALDLRGGYGYEPSPAPPQKDEQNLVDNDKHTFSIGVGFTARPLAVLLDGVSIDAHFALTYLPDRAHDKLSSTDRFGDYVSDGVIPQLGLTLRTRFE